MSEQYQLISKAHNPCIIFPTTQHLDRIRSLVSYNQQKNRHNKLVRIYVNSKFTINYRTHANMQLTSISDSQDSLFYVKVNEQKYLTYSK